MLLILAVAILTPVVAVGGWLGGLYLFVEKPPGRLNWIGILHGSGGAAGFGVMVAALAGAGPSAHAVRLGAGAFGVFSAVLITAAFTAGLAILLTHLRRRRVGRGLVAAHGLLAISGYTLLLTYLTMLR